MTLTTVKERPIHFNSENARAIVEGQKWQTRRPVKEPLQINLPQRVTSDLPAVFGTVLVAPSGIHTAKMNPFGAVFIPFPDGRTLEIKPNEFEWVSPFGKPGDRLWVRETWAKPICDCGVCSVREHVRYRASWALNDYVDRWRPSIHMPRWAARSILEVTGVRVERIQDMTFADWRADFAPSQADIEKAMASFTGAAYQREHSKARWDAIYADRGFGWDLNPHVWVVEFKRVESDVAR